MSTSSQGVQPAEKDTERARYGRLLDVNTTAIAVTNEELDKLSNIAVKSEEALTGDEITFRNKCLFLSGTLERHKETLKNTLVEQQEERNKLLDLLNTSKVYLLLFVCNAFRGKPV